MQETRLHARHVALGARMVEFGGWSMPVQYGPILDEVRCVREKAGLFDLGHMGRFHVTGPDAVALVDRVATNYCAKIPVSAIRYALLCNADGFPIDDVLLYREEDSVFIVVNASNTERDLAWIRSHTGDLDAVVEDQTDALAMLALQGQASQAVLQNLTEDTDLAGIKYYRFGWGTVAGIPNVRISRTGYTGEDGFEVYLPQDEAVRVWDALLEAGAPHGLQPIGLGARDTLRLEAGMPLYGHEIDEAHGPLEAGLAFGVSFHEDKGDYLGRAALEHQRDHPTRRLVGIATDGKRAPREGYKLFAEGQEIGEVRSGGVSPTVGKNIGSAFVRLGFDEAGRELEMDIRGKRQPCVVQELPFYSRTRK